ncbi:MAG TPA: BlaI/MecI/CopY family transcriptional regulator [Armatimonadota bacterium]|jgi:predicted transcriptional regulator
MRKSTGPELSRRERQILDILFQREKASASEVLEALPDPPSYSSVRTLLRILEEKGHARHEEDGKRYLYRPTQARTSAARGALRNVLHTFFGGSLTQAVATLLSDNETDLSDDDLARLEALIEEARTTEENGEPKGEER